MVVECLPSLCEAPNSIPAPQKKKIQVVPDAIQVEYEVFKVMLWSIRPLTLCPGIWPTVSSVELRTEEAKKDFIVGTVSPAAYEQ